MSLRHRIVSCLLGLGFMLVAAGCANNRDVEQTRQSTVPWGRPAEWEGRIPGMGGF
jgi:hypothetical protein